MSIEPLFWTMVQVLFPPDWVVVDGLAPRCVVVDGLAPLCVRVEPSTPLAWPLAVAPVEPALVVTAPDAAAPVVALILEEPTATLWPAWPAGAAPLWVSVEPSTPLIWPPKTHDRVRTARTDGTYLKSLHFKSKLKR
jgi:hypothetical protein